MGGRPNFGLGGREPVRAGLRSGWIGCGGSVGGLVSPMENDPGDRHVLAAAVKCGDHAIVTDTIKQFPRDCLEPFGGCV